MASDAAVRDAQPPPTASHCRPGFGSAIPGPPCLTARNLHVRLSTHPATHPLYQKYPVISVRTVNSVVTIVGAPCETVPSRHRGRQESVCPDGLLLLRVAAAAPGRRCCCSGSTQPLSECTSVRIPVLFDARTVLSRCSACSHVDVCDPRATFPFRWDNWVCECACLRRSCFLVSSYRSRSSSCSPHTRGYTSQTQTIRTLKYSLTRRDAASLQPWPRRD